jgi:phosphoglycolate phosphatase (TIGR01487 family)
VLKSLGHYVGCTGPLVCENGGVVEYKGRMWVLSDNRNSADVVFALREAYGKRVEESWSNKYRFVDMAIIRNLDMEEVQSVVKRFDGMKVIDSGFAYHILDEKVNKGTALLKAISVLGIQQSEVAGVGDSTTDIELLRSCGLRCAVANGDKRIKEIADFIAVKPFGQGFAEIAHMILSRQGFDWHG